MRVTRRYRFSASHRLHTDELSEQENRDLYGKCNNPYGHGHDYALEVSVSGPLDPASGLVVNRATLDKLVNDAVLKDFEHRNLNEDVSEFASSVPTTENIIVVIENRLKNGWNASFPASGPQLEKIRLQETRRNLFELKA